MPRIATPEKEDFLLTIAQHGTASHVEQTVAKYRRVKHQSSLEPERDQRDERK